MANVLILLTLPEDVRVQYRDRLREVFPQLKINLVDHHDHPMPVIENNMRAFLAGTAPTSMINVVTRS